LWSTNDAGAFSEFNRVSFYLGVFVLVLQVAPRVPLHRLGDGLALGISAVVALALFSRIAPGIFSDRALTEALPTTAARLSYPIGYWNGLAVLAALAVPLLLRAAASPGHRVRRSLAAAPLPAVVATIYLASSRGGMATAAAGIVVYLALSRFRWGVVGALVAAGAGSALALGVLVSQSEFVNEPLAVSRTTRASIALMLLAGCCVTFALQAALTTLSARNLTLPRWVGFASIAAAVAVAATAVVAADPAERLRTFKRPPAESTTSGDAILSHLVSVGGSGRWQFWESALHAWQKKPVLGHGAGSYEAWWAQHGTLAIFVRDAHSLYFETLAELGVVGLALLVGAGATALVAAWRSIRRLPAAGADAVAAATAVVVAYAAAAAIDWMWELPVVTLVAVTCLAVILTPTRTTSRGSGKPARAVLVVVAILVVVAQAIPYLSQTRVRESQSAASRGDLAGALASARTARDVQPWAADPWLQLALVYELRGELERARAAIVRATEENPDDWRLWLVAARLETKLGRIDEARRSLRRAIELNPRSPLFKQLP
jgi:hypothetical protein